MNVATEVTPEEIGRWHRSTRLVSAPLRHVWLNVELHDVENVAPDGGVLLAANHLSFLDSMLLMYSLPRPVTFLGKAEYLNGRITRTLFPAAGMIPVDRSGRGITRSLGLAADRLRRGEVVGIFPEGTRSRDGCLHRGHAGVAHLALRTGVSIVPVGIRGTDAALPPGARVPQRRAAVSIHYGAPISVAPWLADGATGTAKREITDEVMQSIAALSGQVYEDEYAAVPVA